MGCGSSRPPLSRLRRSRPHRSRLAPVPAAPAPTASGPAVSVSATPVPAAPASATPVPAVSVSATPVAASAAAATRTGLATALATCLALTWLNPHVYLDTVFLLGSIASTHGADRWWFALGAVTGSAVWFFALGYGARLLGRWLATARAWRILDAVIAVIMLALAVNLLRGV
ncbi:LysE/ArgO family amino acid transporter [Microbacterium elymi]|uniref:LysE/ArgO family amino acid transporter n=1 Tax=Microbacterium elymi TaxID=2909587 RepID=UPI003F4927B0